MPLTEYGCPACPKENPGQINYSSGSITCSLNPAHRWNDSMEFAKLQPVKKFTVAPPKFAAQTNHVKMEAMVPLGVKQALETRWAGKLEATVGGVLTMLSEGECLIVPKSDLQRMKERLGKIPESSSELFGLIYALGEAANDAKSEAAAAQQDLAAYKGLSRTSVVINLGDQYSAAADKARSQEPPEPIEIFLNRNLKNALSENWF